MPYFKPYIDEAGIHVPEYVDTRDELLAKARGIFGQDIYLDEDSQDYELLAILAEKISDTNQGLVAAYHSFDPAAVYGAPQDRLYALNGITRKGKSYSKCELLITGEPGTVIHYGIAGDGTYQWPLPAKVTIPPSGSIKVSVTCATAGAIEAPANTITQIVTPMGGWTEVTNPAKAAPGLDTETHEQYRTRQRTSTAQPSRSILDGTEGAIWELDGVKRARVYENDTNVIDELGQPPHCITAVVEGGNDEEIARAILLKKNPGCSTNGDVSIMVDKVNRHPQEVRFFRPAIIDVEVLITLKALYNYTEPMAGQIKEAVTEYVNTMDIGANLTISALWGISLAANTDMKNPSYSITSIEARNKGADEYASNDIQIDYNAVAACSLADITVEMR